MTRSGASSPETGAEVTREYYFNDHGGQIDRFSGSLLASAHGQPAPEDGYGGAYIDDIAQAVLVKHPGRARPSGRRGAEVFRAEGVEMMFAEIKESLHEFGVDFDVYFHEDNLHASGAVQKAIDRLTELGNTYEQDGALWLRTEKFGDDKDRVIIRSDGNGSYFSGDLAYYLDKREPGLRPVLHHARRGPPRLRRPADGDVRGLRRRAARQPRDPDRPDGQPAP